MELGEEPSPEIGHSRCQFSAQVIVMGAETFSASASGPSVALRSKSGAQVMQPIHGALIVECQRPIELGEWKSPVGKSPTQRPGAQPHPGPQ